MVLRESKVMRPTARAPLQRYDLQNLDASLKKQRQKDEEEIKLLLLGAGESGKSTIFKQLQLINNGGFSENTRTCLIDVIRENIIQSMQVPPLSALENHGDL
jgi:GTPase SAR1 family protein